MFIYRCYPINTALADPIDLDRRLREYNRRDRESDSEDDSDDDSASSNSSDSSDSSDVSSCCHCQLIELEKQCLKPHSNNNYNFKNLFSGLK